MTANEIVAMEARLMGRPCSLIGFGDVDTEFGMVTMVVYAPEPHAPLSGRLLREVRAALHVEGDEYQRTSLIVGTKWEDA